MIKWLCFSSLLLFLGYFFYPRPSKDFSISAISSQHAFQPEWEGRALSLQEEQEIEQALNQSYRYFGKGGQCFIFSSKDGKYVVKFFKQRVFAIPAWLKTPFLGCYRERKVQKKEQKRNMAYRAFKLAFDLVPEETGMILIHLNRGKQLFPQQTLFEVANKRYPLNLNEFDFVIQKQATLASTQISSLLAQDQRDEATKAIDQLLTLPALLHTKGLRNRDPNFRNNYGFLNDRPVLIDVGRLTDNASTEEGDRALARLHASMRRWLEKCAPEMLVHFDTQVAGEKG